MEKDTGFINSLKSDLHKLNAMSHLLENTENIYGECYSELKKSIDETTEEVNTRIKNLENK